MTQRACRQGRCEISLTTGTFSVEPTRVRGVGTSRGSRCRNSEAQDSKAIFSSLDVLM